MDTKTEIARITREIAKTTDKDHAMQNHAISGQGMAVPAHFDASEVTGGTAAREHAQRDKNLSTVPTPKKP
jgi:hypothetical protein